jgi:hypothetical protein
VAEIRTEDTAFGHSDLPLITWVGILTVVFGPLVATIAGLPLWVGLPVAAGILFGVPLFAVHVVDRCSPGWAERIFEWHLAASGWAVVALTIAGVGAVIWRGITG